MGESEVAALPPVLHIRLLGDFALSCDDRPVEGITTPRLQSLIGYLVLHRDAPQLRQHLAFVFWPDSSEMQARNNLRQLIHVLRRALPSESVFLASDNRTLQWRREAPLQLDVDDLDAALAEIEDVDHQWDASALHAIGQRINELYRDDLLPGCYDEWVAPERERLRARFLQGLDRLIALNEAQRNYTDAIHCARRALHFDQLNEEAYRTLMRLFALSGDRTRALRVFQTCATVLRRELGIEPGEETQALYQRLLRPAARPDQRDSRDRPDQRDQREESLPATPTLVGRQREWETLRRAWQAANTQGPGFALISGEPGIGKSRLAEDLARWTSQLGATIATTRSYAVEGRLSLAPVVEWLRSSAFRPHVARLETVWLTEAARILPELFTEHPDLPHYEPMGEYGQRQRFFQALALAVLTAPQPLLLVIDDLQWCDQDTLEWLHFLLRFDAHARLLVLGTVRTGELSPQHPLRTLLQHLRHTVAVTEIALPPLDAAETAMLAASMIDRELDTASAMRLFGETEGNPLFVIEAVRAGLDELLKQPLPEERLAFPYTPTHDLPAGVRTIISGRLAQLSPPARELAALAAVVGREFSFDILTQASQSDEESIVRALDELWERRIVQEQGAATYDFTHDKLREVAYAEISAPQRQLWHRRIARALETLFADHLDPVSGQIAAHYEHGGAIEHAIPYYQRAALVARRLFAHEDAILLLRHCLTLLKQRPGGAARDKQELDFLLALEPLYRITQGWTGPELERVIDRTLVLCDLVGDDAQRAKTLYGLQALVIVQARLDRVQLVSEELHAVYERTQAVAPPLLDMMLAGARLHLGRLTEANDGFTSILATHDVRQVLNFLESITLETQGWNFAVHTRAWQSHVLWCLGYPDRAMRSALDAVDLAQSLEQYFNGALATTFIAMLSQMSADATTARRRAEEALELTAEYKSPYYHAWSEILARHAYAREQPDEAHIEALRNAIEAFTSIGVRLRLPYFLSLLADIYGLAQRPEEALKVIEDALIQSRSSSERWWDAELHRQRGVFMLAAGHDEQDALAALVRAANIARGQQSRMLELRALVTLGRTSMSGQQMEETRRTLEALYAQFTEGFDSPDLQAANALLDQWKLTLH
jgi:DNA-binding SARP family transcriptional activator/predicted ATPase